ncbi:MAG TPA: MscL family protein [Gaiellaceae bacterium]|nr:MscL family protein [Gaiellaceae bacterium]
MSALRGLKNFLMQGDLVVVAVGLSIALAFSTLVQEFTFAVITPLVDAAGSGGANGLGFTVNGQRVQIGVLISAIIYFIVFVAVVYFAIVVPYRIYQRRRGVAVFTEPPPTKACPACLSDGLPLEATKCRYCGTALTATDTGGLAAPA